MFSSTNLVQSGHWMCVKPSCLSFKTYSRVNMKGKLWSRLSNRMCQWWLQYVMKKKFFAYVMMVGKYTWFRKNVSKTGGWVMNIFCTFVSDKAGGTQLNFDIMYTCICCFVLSCNLILCLVIKTCGTNATFSTDCKLAIVELIRNQQVFLLRLNRATTDGEAVCRMIFSNDASFCYFGDIHFFTFHSSCYTLVVSSSRK